VHASHLRLCAKEHSGYGMAACAGVDAGAGARTGRFPGAGVTASFGALFASMLLLSNALPAPYPDSFVACVSRWLQYRTYTRH
jgi:hypothetical protein